MTASIRTAVAEDIDAILADIRPADVAEMEAMGTTPERAMREGLARSDWTATGLWNDRPVCMFGVAPMNVMLGHGAPWLLGANALEHVQVPFLRASRPAVTAMLASYPRLMNMIDSRNTVAIRWLRWLGFTFDPRPLALGEHVFLVFKAGEWNV